jgi:virginiamycin B lyase
MYVEYYLPMDPKLDANNPQRRGQDPHFDNSGNVWYTDRSIPNRIGKLDPRTGTIKDYVTPNPKGGLHGITVDKQGQVWFNETTGMHLGRFDPKTAEFTRYEVDVKKEIKEHAEGHTPVVDSRQNVWFTVINGTKLARWDRKTEKVTLWDPPTRNSFPYGIVVDKNDTIWFAEFTGCKITKFDPSTEKFTEYTPPTKPCLIRRLGIDHKGIVWFGEFSSGKIGRLDPATGKITEYSLPLPFSQPYDTWPDAQDNIWIGDGGQVGTLIKFDQRTEKFTYYPSPQRTDMPKLEITREGAIWYCPRSADLGAVGVLYPDVDKITTMAAFY